MHVLHTNQYKLILAIIINNLASHENSFKVYDLIIFYSAIHQFFNVASSVLFYSPDTVLCDFKWPHCQCIFSSNTENLSLVKGLRLVRPATNSKANLDQGVEIYLPQINIKIFSYHTHSRSFWSMITTT